MTPDYLEEPPVGEWMCWGLLVLIICFLLLVALSGCASITPVYGEDGRPVRVESKKFLADLNYEREWEVLAPDGKTVLRFKEKYATVTNADRIMSGAATLAGELVNGASKVMP